MALSLRDFCEAGFLLPREALELLIENYPTSYSGLVRNNIPEDLVLKLASKKLAVNDTTFLCRAHNEKVLAHIAATERRRGPLEAILNRAQLGADVQKKITGRKLHEEVCASLIKRGITLEAAERLWRKNDLNIAMRIMLIEMYIESFPAQLIADSLRDMYHFPTFGGLLAARRPDARALVLSEDVSSSWQILASATLTVDEQHIIAERLQSDHCSVMVAAGLLDRPTTVIPVREALWDKFHNKLDELGWMTPTPDTWPEVNNVGNLDEVSQRHFLQREATPPWSVTRSIQAIEMLVTAGCKNHRTACWRQINAATTYEQRFKVGFSLLPPNPTSHLSIDYGFAHAVQAVEDRISLAQRATEISGVEISGTTRSAFYHGNPEDYSPDGSFRLKELRRWDTDKICKSAAYLAQELKNDRQAWRVVFEMLPSFPGTTAELAQLALAATS